MRMLDQRRRRSDRPLHRPASAHELGLRVVAEGVESAECNQWLAELGCDLVQGFYFGRAMPPDAIAHWTAGQLG